MKKLSAGLTNLSEHLPSFLKIMCPSFLLGCTLLTFRIIVKLLDGISGSVERTTDDIISDLGLQVDESEFFESDELSHESV